MYCGILYNISSSLLFLCSLLLGDYKGAKLSYSFHPHPNPLPSRAREGICGVLPLKAREEKERGFIRGNSFPPYTEESVFLSSVVFFFLYFFVFWGIIKGHSPL